MGAVRPSVMRFKVRGRSGVPLLFGGLMMVCCAALEAQSVVGMWQGTLPAPTGRVVVKVTQTQDRALRGMLSMVDRGPGGAPILAVSYAAPAMSFNVGDIHYTGKLSGDGNSMVGIWSQLGESHALTLVRATSETVWSYVGPAPTPAMAATADPAFEVASIRPSKPGGGQMTFVLTRQLRAENVSLKDLIKMAYDVRGRQVESGPSWIDDEKFDVMADPDTPGMPSMDQRRTMVRKLLEERFGLKVHLTQQEFPVYALVVEKSTGKLMRSEPAVNGHMSIYTRPEVEGELSAQLAYCTMTDFARLMMDFIQSHQIVDETGLEGKYDFVIKLPTSALRPAAGPEDNPDAVFEQAIRPLGLKFVLKKRPLQIVIVDKVEQPSPN